MLIDKAHVVYETEEQSLKSGVQSTKFLYVVFV